ncbi:hypothetical protein K440DRAFT_634952, partial [Wilcoxina mikolae CBS 423.85]
PRPDDDENKVTLSPNTTNPLPPTTTTTTTTSTEPAPSPMLYPRRIYEAYHRVTLHDILLTPLRR